jgi:hypothetical protein
MQLKIQRSQRMGGLIGNTVLFCLDVRADYAPPEAANIAKYKLGKEVIYNSRAAKRHLDTAGAQLDRTQSGGVGERAAGLARGAVSMAIASMHLNISIASLGRGHHIECKDLTELMEAENAVMDACRNVRDFLNLAATFNGSTILVDFSEKDEQVHTAMGGEVYAPLPLAASAGAPSDLNTATDAVFEEMPAGSVMGAGLTPTDMAQFQFGDMQEVVASVEEKVRALYAEHPQAFWIGGAAVAGLLTLILFGPTTLIVLLVIAVPAFFLWRAQNR